MNHEVPLEEMTRRGKMVKRPEDMTPEEYANWKIQVQIDVREYLFSIGQPYVTVKNGNTVAEFADGRVQRVD